MEQLPKQEIEEKKPQIEAKPDEIKVVPQDKPRWWTFQNLDSNIKVTMIGVFGLAIVALFKFSRSDNSQAAEIWKIAYQNEIKGRADDKLYYIDRLDKKDELVRQIRREKDSLIGIAHKENIDLAIIAGFRKALNEINK